MRFFLAFVLVAAIGGGAYYFTQKTDSPGTGPQDEAGKVGAGGGNVTVTGQGKPVTPTRSGSGDVEAQAAKAAAAKKLTAGLDRGQVEAAQARARKQSQEEWDQHVEQLWTVDVMNAAIAAKHIELEGQLVAQPHVAIEIRDDLSGLMGSLYGPNAKRKADSQPYHAIMPSAMRSIESLSQNLEQGGLKIKVKSIDEIDSNRKRGVFDTKSNETEIKLSYRGNRTQLKVSIDRTRIDPELWDLVRAATRK